MAKAFQSAARLNAAAIERIAARVAGLSKAQIDKADRRAIASVRRRFEPAAKRVVVADYNVRTGQLSGVFQVRSGADASGEYLELHASTRRLPLLGFGARWAGRHTAGATAWVRRDGGRKVYRSAFIATIGGQRRVVARQFSRDATTPSGRDPRNKLRSLTGPSPLQMVKGYDDANAKQIAFQMNSFRAAEIIRQLGLARKGKG